MLYHYQTVLQHNSVVAIEILSTASIFITCKSLLLYNVHLSLFRPRASWQQSKERMRLTRDLQRARGYVMDALLRLHWMEKTLPEMRATELCVFFFYIHKQPLLFCYRTPEHCPLNVMFVVIERCNWENTNKNMFLLQILQYDMWGVTPSDMWNWQALKEDIKTCVYCLVQDSIALFHVF